MFSYNEEIYLLIIFEDKIYFLEEKMKLAGFLLNKRICYTILINPE